MSLLLAQTRQAEKGDIRELHDLPKVTPQAISREAESKSHEPHSSPVSSDHAAS